ncbi:glycosyltransferase [Liquorilactobacillus uvarum]|nr:glycosyltransferase [Liquorilactobacillus uvarum]
MIKISIVGYNIFSPGGTTRSNLNLIAEFSSQNYTVVYYNYTDFDELDLRRLHKHEKVTADVQIKKVEELYSKTTAKQSTTKNYFFITREDLFPLAAVIRKYNLKALIIGEVHTPLSLLNKDFASVDLSPFTCLRVATPAIKKRFAQKYHFERIYVQMVSLDHLQLCDPAKVQRSKTSNFLVYARFDEDAKDISYAIKLAAHMINELKGNNIRLYINGYGPDKLCYEKMIAQYQLKNAIFINKRVPSNYIALSTSHVETLGYAIAESLAQGHRVLAYVGDDHVTYENFKGVPLISWIYKKDIAIDAQQALRVTSENIKTEELATSINLLKQMKAGYVKKMFKNVSSFEGEGAIAVDENKNIESETKRQIESVLGAAYAPWYLKIYRHLRQVPGLRKLLQQSKLSEWLKLLRKKQ